jgi:glycosyltransferase involved in cell wall biosynthesis
LELIRIAGTPIKPAQRRRVAIVHDWLVVYGGAERCLRQLIGLFPDAELFAIVDFFSDDDRARLFGKRARTSFIQTLPFARTKYRTYLPLMPLAVEQFDLSAFDMVISSSHAVAKGVLTGPDQEHICYCHTPIRYAWDLQHQYLRESGLTRGVKSAFSRLLLHYIRLWDTRTAWGVDRFIANSAYVARRILKVYGREAEVIYPPVDIDRFSLRRDKEDFYLTASRMVQHKRICLTVEAFAAMPEKRLLVIGDGPEMAKIRAMAGPNVTLLGIQNDVSLCDYLQRAKAFICAAEEDFGILAVEAQACGTPVIAFGKGGAMETIIGPDNPAGDEPTGIFFEAQTAGALITAVERFETVKIRPEACRNRAETFSISAFKAAWIDILKKHQPPLVRPAQAASR